MHELAYPRFPKGRQDARPPSRQRVRGNRPVACVNLGRLADVMSIDVLASSLGLSEPNLLKIIQGHESGNEYQAHIEDQFKRAGVPVAWLNQTQAPIKPEFVELLRRSAASSANKAPIRRHNLQALVDAFTGRTDALARALDINQTTVHSLIDGSLVLTDERVNHLNPRLMAAGFPDSWLDQAQAKVERAWVPQLEALTGAEEQEYQAEQAEDERRRKELALPASQVAPLPPAAPAVNESVRVEPLPEVAPTSEPAATDDSAEPAGTNQPPATKPILREPTQASLLDADDSSPEPTLPAQAGSAANELPRPSPPAMVGRPSNTSFTTENPPMTKNTQENDLPKFTTGNFAGASKPTASKLPRGAMGAGRTIGSAQPSAPAAPAPAQKAAAPMPAANAAAPVAKRAAPVSRVAAPTARPAAKAPPVLLKPTRRKPIADDVPNTRGGKSPITREQSVARAEALDKLLEGARRGAKVMLWRDLMGMSLAQWGNIRRGVVMFRDELAQPVTQHLQLPEGWLDNPQYPPATMAAWVTDPNAPVPGSTDTSTSDKDAQVPGATQALAADPDPAAAPAPAASPAPFSRKQPSAPTVTIASARRGPPPKPAQASQPVAPPASSPSLPADVPMPISPAAQAADRVPQELAGSSAGTFTWAPESKPQSITAPGPVVQALKLLVDQLALEGRFTDADAMRMIAMLATTR
jgi:hypothetical protein